MKQSLIEFKSRLNVTALQKISTKQPPNDLTHAICIQNLIKKNSNFVPGKVQPLYPEQSSKTLHGLTKLMYKKQIRSHQNRSFQAFTKKTKTSLINQRMPELKQSKHGKHISAIWHSKKNNQRRRIQVQQQKKSAQPSTASFYTKKGGQAVQYDLKMQIKRVEAIPLSQQNKYRNRLHKKSLLIANQMDKSKNLKIQPMTLFDLKNENEQYEDLSFQKNSQPMKPRYNKQRYIKSTLISYSTKTKLSKKKIEQQIPQIHHIRNLINSPFMINQQNIPLFRYQQFQICDEMSINNQFMGVKTANHISVFYINNELRKLRPLFMRDQHQKVQIASITKIMTCLVVLHIVQYFKININMQKVIVSERASKMPGTTAGLNYSDTLTVYQLLHALMLPSGNDAAVSLSQWGGKTIRKHFNVAQKYTQNKIENKQTKSMNFLVEYVPQKKSHKNLFLYYMNKAASVLNLKNTKFANAHGLMNKKAFSCAYDVAKLTYLAMKNNEFRKIVSTKQFSCELFNRTYSQSKTVLWKNTNKLLEVNGFLGVKTGVTPSAGPCLSSMFSISKNQQIVIVVLKVKTMQLRFKQTFQILKQCLSYFGLEKNAQYENIKTLQDEQSTLQSIENYRQELANLIEEQKQNNSDQDQVQQRQDQQN